VKRWLTLAGLAVGLVLVSAGSAAAHPLGNFTVNHYNGIALLPDRVEVLAIVDIAEIPTAQELPAADPNTQSAGLVDLKRARDKPMPSVLASAQPFAPSTCLGSLEAARGSHLVADEDVELVARVTSSAPSTS